MEIECIAQGVEVPRRTGLRLHRCLAPARAIARYGADSVRHSGFVTGDPSFRVVSHFPSVSSTSEFGRVRHADVPSDSDRAAFIEKEQE